MGPVVALFFALAAVQAVPINNFNNIDIFYPMRNLDIAANRYSRAYPYYLNWWNPAFGYYQRYFQQGLAPFSPEYQHYQNQIYNSYYRQNALSVHDLFERPVIVVTPSGHNKDTFAAFFLHSGLRSLFRYNSFVPLQQYLMNPSLKGLIFFPNNIYNIRFFEIPVSSITVPEHFRMSEFLKSVDYPESIPILFVAPEDVFAQMHFENIAKVTDFRVFNNAIEVAPFSSLASQSQLQQIFWQQHGNQVQPVSHAIHQSSHESHADHHHVQPVPASNVEASDVFRANLLTTPTGLYGQNVLNGYQSQDFGRLQPEQPFGVYNYGVSSNQGVLANNMYNMYNGQTHGSLGKVIETTFVPQVQEVDYRLGSFSGSQSNSVALENIPSVHSNQQTVQKSVTSSVLTNPVPVVSTERQTEVYSDVKSGKHKHIASEMAASFHPNIEKSNVVETTITKTISTSPVHPQLNSESHSTLVEKSIVSPHIASGSHSSAGHQAETHFETGNIVYPGKTVGVQSLGVEVAQKNVQGLSASESLVQNLNKLEHPIHQGEAFLSRTTTGESVLGSVQGSGHLHSEGHHGGSTQTTVVTTKETSSVSKSGGSVVGGLLGSLSGGLSVSGNTGISSGISSQHHGGSLSRTTITEGTQSEHSSSAVSSNGQLNVSLGIGAQGRSLLKSDEALKKSDMIVTDSMTTNEGILGKTLNEPATVAPTMLQPIEKSSMLGDKLMSN